MVLTIHDSGQEQKSNIEKSSCLKLLADTNKVLNMVIKFEKVQQGIEIIDPVEKCRERIQTATTEQIRAIDWTHKRYPVDTAVEVVTDSFVLPNTSTLNIRDESQDVILKSGPSEDVRTPKGNYVLDLSRSVKIYISVESRMRVTSVRSGKRFSFPGETEVRIGARSYHTRPAGIIKTTTSPRDVMEAVSSFGSALKTAGPERSYSTLRGHPPLLQKGEQLDIPRHLRQNKTPIQIEVPPTLRHVYVVTPLAYYLGAKVVPGSEPRLVLDDEHYIGLNERNQFERSISCALRRLFFLDCILRTEGNSPGPVHDRLAVESDLGFTVSELYNQSFTEQIKAYFQVPFSVIETQYPRWNPQTFIEPNKDLIEFLPFIANSLSIVTAEPKDENISSRETFGQTTTEAGKPRGQATAPAIRQRWNCSNGPQIISTVPLAAFHNATNQKPKDEPLKIQIICNDKQMSEELIAAYSAYGVRDVPPFNVNSHHDLTTGQLRRVLETDSDFIHYIGHIDADGFRCTDGHLDSATLDSVGTDTFFLNACQSRDQGINLINAGSTGGIVTYDEVQNHCAVEVGSMIARLLNLGYPLYAAVDIARVRNPAGKQYHLVGDGSKSVAQSSTVIPNSCLIRQDGSNLQIVINQYPSREGPKGCIFVPSIESIDEYHLAQQRIGPYSVSKSELIKFLDINPIPVIIDGSVHWSDELHIADIPSV
jgi:hypothetical protein